MRFALIGNKTCTMMIYRFHLAYHMALSQYILSDAYYRQMYALLHERDHFIMLDNGAAENGHSIGIENVMIAARMIDADEIVMPDVLDECRSTIAATRNALQYVPIRQRAVVPQGRNWEDWEYCATTLVAMGCRTICVAKRYEQFDGGRAHALQIIEHNGWHKAHDVHLLGCFRNPLLEIRAALKVAPWIRGIDTAAPVSFAQVSRSLQGGEWNSLDWDAPIDFTLAEKNVDLILRTCHAHHTEEPGN